MVHAGLREGEKVFFKELMRYYSDFLETGFHRQSIPKRFIRLRDNNGYLSGINLAKYEKFQEFVLKNLINNNEPFVEFEIKKGQHKLNLKPNLKSLITEIINSIDETALENLVISYLANIVSIRTNHIDDYDSFFEQVIENIREELLQKIIRPLSSNLDKALQQDTTFTIENDLLNLLLGNIREDLNEHLASFFINEEIDNFKLALLELLNISIFKEKLHDFFEDFMLYDLFYEIFEIFENKQLTEKKDFYLYFCDIHFEKRIYPVFYLPIKIEKQNDLFSIVIEKSRVFINKKAIEYIVQEYNKDNDNQKFSKIRSVKDHIVYLNDDEKTILTVLQPIISDITRHFSFLEDINLSDHKSTKRQSPTLKITNNIHFCLFDTSDEAILNDYEELINVLNPENNPLSLAFVDFLKSFILEDPISRRKEIETDWEQKNISERLVYDSPVPLNAEQRKIITALNEKDCKCIAVQGPPGTGKSHTITAIVFDMIMKGKSVLILSDKTEALDVVQDKINDTCNKVRGAENFSNPILRLDKPNFSKIFSHTSISKIRNHYICSEELEDINSKICKEKKELINKIEQTINYYDKINIKELNNFIKLEKTIEQKIGEQNIDGINLISPILPNIKSFFEFLINLHDSFDEKVLNVFIQYLNNQLSSWNDKNLKETIDLFVSICSWYDKYRLHHHLDIMLKMEEQPLLEIRSIVKQYNLLSKKFFKFLYKSQVVALEQRLNDIFKLEKHLNLSQEAPLIIETLVAIDEIIDLANKQNFPKKEFMEFYDFFTTNNDSSYIDFLSKISDTFPIPKLGVPEINILKNLGIDLSFVATKDRESIKSLLKQTCLVDEYCKKKTEYKEIFSSIPDMNYLNYSQQISKLHTLLMISSIDDKVLDFYENKRSTSTTLKNIISKRQKFPRVEFDNIKETFPCIIAGIRNYSEYIPLKEGLFDLVIIDEASQVSLAQAFPAILRAKKIIVLGDTRQFSNVKTSAASKIISNSYLDKLIISFKDNISKDTLQLERMKQLDIKTSVLDFFSFIANYSIMLRKHFRGYREIISFSSKYFYDGQLQAIKIRGKPIDDVLKFTVLQHDEKLETPEDNNTNPFEAEFIVQELERLVSEKSSTSVGVITPFVNQQKFISNVVRKSKFAEDIYLKLKLKIMTFDSCQGEERDIIFYSMTASPVSDKTNYIFSANIEDSNDDVKKIRLQRLNVGFSRAKECMHFVLSKPINEFSGSIRTALNFYENQLLQAKELPSKEDVDPSSPMEQKVLLWIQDAQFYQKNREFFSIQAQFPIGDYLKQLDHRYNHPRYRCDFFLQYRNKNQSNNIIIEYDGFKEHFTNLSEVNHFNYEFYYKKSDIEREKILEGYGCQFIRINRFNLGKNPSDTISKKLENIIKKTNKDYF